MKRPALATLVAGLLALLLAPFAASAQPVLNVYNWTDYIDPYVVQRFQQETGIRVRYDVYDSLETLEGKLSAGRSGYDLIVPTSEPTFARLVRAGALRPLDRARIPNWRNLDPALMARVAAVDPGNAHGAIYLWGTVGLGIRLDRVRAIAPELALDSLDLLLKPENAAQLAALRPGGDGQRDRCAALGAALARPQPRQRRAGRPARRRDGAAGGAAASPRHPRLRRAAGHAGDRGDLRRPDL